MSPSLANDFLLDIFDSRLQVAVLVKGYHYENIGDKANLFKDLEKAIVAHHPINFNYAKREGLKSFSLTKLSGLVTLNTFFKAGPQINQKLDEDGGLIISAKVAHSNQIIPIVRYWIPHIKVISPEDLQVEIDKGLKEYLGRSE